MSDNKPERLIKFAQDQLWAILPESLEQIMTIANRQHEGDLEAVAARLGRPLDNTRTVTVRDGTAIIPVHGPIFRYADFFTAISGGATIEQLALDLTEADENPQIDQIILDLDTPGGMVAGVSEFAKMVRDTKTPVIAYVSNQAASAGYWIASAADEIVLTDTGMVGSIGVVSKFNTSKDKDTLEIVSSQSPYKRPDINTETGRAHVQSSIDMLADIFIETVANNRGASIDTVLNDFGQGGMLIGELAVQAGMADSVGTLESLIGRESGHNLDEGMSMSDNDKKSPDITLGFIASEYPDIASALRKQGEDEAMKTIEDLVTMAKVEGAEAECERIKAVESAALPGHEDLINQLKFDGKTTGDMAALAVVQAEKANLGKVQGQVQDRPEPVKVSVPDEKSVKGNPDAPLEDRAQATWDSDPELRQEFSSFDAFLSYMRATEAGNVKVLKK